MKKGNLLAAAVLLLTSAVGASDSSATSLEEIIAGRHTILLSDRWGGGHRIQFDFNGHTAWLVEPDAPAPDRVWFWTMQWVDAYVSETGRDKLVQRGLYHVHLDVHELRANDEGLAELGKFQDYLVKELGFARKARLVGMSWGGFYSIRYTARFPDRVDRIYLDAPLMNVYTRPSEDLGPWLATMTTAGGVDDPEQPINMAPAIVAAKVPIFLVYGGADVDVVPKDNCEIFISRYQAAGGAFDAVDLDPTRGHHPHGPSAGYFGRLLDFMTEGLPKARIGFVGDMTPGTNFVSVTANVSAQVLDCGCSSPAATVEVSLVPVGGGDRRVSSFEIADDCDVHVFAATFSDLTPGRRYRIEARVIFGGEEKSAARSTVVTSREFTWFAEDSETFPNAGWTYDRDLVGVADGLIVGPKNECQTVSFAPPSEDGSGRNRILLQLALDYGVDFDRLEPIDGRAGVTCVLDADGVPRLAVWGQGAWRMTDLELVSGEERTVEVTLDRPEGTVGYRLMGKDGGWAEAGRYPLADASPVSAVAVNGLIKLRRLEGSHYSANLVADDQGSEYADYATAKAFGAKEPLHPLWFSTWSLEGSYGSMTYRDPDGFVSFTGASRIIGSEAAGADGVMRCWYGPVSDAELADGADRYVRQTVALGLEKAITDRSDIRLSECEAGDAGLSFRVGIDGADVMCGAVTSLVEVCDDLLRDSWRTPTSVRFAEGKVIVAPTPGAARNFARVKVADEPTVSD